MVIITKEDHWFTQEYTARVSKTAPGSLYITGFSVLGKVKTGFGVWSVLEVT